MERIPEDELSYEPSRELVRVWVHDALLDLAIQFIVNHLPERED